MAEEIWRETEKIHEEKGESKIRVALPELAYQGLFALLKGLHWSIPGAESAPDSSTAVMHMTNEP
jgi:hypothetical protein